MLAETDHNMKPDILLKKKDFKDEVEYFSCSLISEQLKQCKLFEFYSETRKIVEYEEDM